MDDIICLKAPQQITIRAAGLRGGKRLELACKQEASRVLLQVLLTLHLFVDVQTHTRMCAIVGLLEGHRHECRRLANLPQVLPVERGAGLEQAGMRAAEARLAAGDWVHVFPEGTRSRDGRMGHARKGVGRLVAACRHAPLGWRPLHIMHRTLHPRSGLSPRSDRYLCDDGGELVPNTGSRIRLCSWNTGAAHSWHHREGVE